MVLSNDDAEVTTSHEGRGAIKARLPAGGPVVAYGPPGPSRPPSASHAPAASHGTGYAPGLDRPGRSGEAQAGLL